MSMLTPCPQKDPLMIAWRDYSLTAEYQNSEKWATNPEHTQGALWAAFNAGFRAATERAIELHEQVDPASDKERIEKISGAGALRAVIDYRDKIRQTIAA